MRALLSVSDKTGLVAFARGLTGRGFELVSTGGTAAALERAGLPVVAVSKVTGVPEMLDGRVKTLHPTIHAGILARRARPDDMATLKQHGIVPIDLVVVNLYPFEQTAASRGLRGSHGRPNVIVDELIEQIDIGGPSLVRAAAKNFRDVLVVVDPSDYERVLTALDRGGVSIAFRLELAVKAFGHTASYDHAIHQALGWADMSDDRALEYVSFEFLKDRDLRYGENPHQQAALFNAELQVLQGKELSYTNLLDLDAAQRMVREFQEPAAVVIKHTNPCGVATGAGTLDAYVLARDADALSAFGGIVGVNRPLDAEVARAITSTFIEAVIAPAVEEEARPILAAKQNLRVVVPVVMAGCPGVEPPVTDDEFRSILGGVLTQTPDRVTEAREPWPTGDFPKGVTKRQPTTEEWEALRFAWRVCAHVKSNAVVFAARDRTLAIGAGQTSRVDAVKVAVMKAGGRLEGSVAASDAFFPFRDGLDAIAAAGATAVVQPGGSVRDAEVIAAADEHELAMVFTAIRHFRH
jgi:phosphoribosylaminoimidazolecarboxamide formyltransferase/IMP cyclohydrolase